MLEGIVFVVVMTGGGRLDSASTGSTGEVMTSFIVDLSLACLSILGGELKGMVIVRGEIVPVAG